MKRDFLTLGDLQPDEVMALLQTAIKMKAERTSGQRGHGLAGKNIGLIFNKPSMRTRVSFEVGITDLGGHAVYMQDAEIQLSRREPISHAARVFSRYLDALVVRTYAQADLEEMAQYATIPVINALTDAYHPCQILADLMTVFERKQRLEGLKAAWIGDGNNVAHSWINAASMLGMELVLAVPEGYEPDAGILEEAVKKARYPITLTRDPAEAVRGAEVINTDAWFSMGQEDQAQSRREIFQPYQVNEELLQEAAPEAMVLHCMPAHLGEEITESVVEGPKSALFDQAENRLHTQKALLTFMVPGSTD